MAGARHRLPGISRRWSETTGLVAAVGDGTRINRIVKTRGFPNPSSAYPMPGWHRESAGRRGSRVGGLQTRKPSRLVRVRRLVDLPPDMPRAVWLSNEDRDACSPCWHGVFVLVLPGLKSRSCTRPSVIASVAILCERPLPHDCETKLRTRTTPISAISMGPLLACGPPVGAADAIRRM